MKRLLAVAAAVLLVAGCTGVPTSSAPETVEPLVTEPGSNIAPPPADLNGDPRSIVQSFLAANATNTGNHNTARAYLTSKTSNRWSDDTATVIANDYSIGLYDTTHHSVTVQARVLGKLDANGIYTPSLENVGGGGSNVPFVFDITQLRNGQNRIAKLRAGLLLSDQQFRATYQQHVVYFFDAAENTLIPDLRWSALDDKTQLAQWLIGQLAAGPRTSLQNAVSLDTLPAQTDVRQITVVLGNPTTVEIPGSSQLDSSVRDRLAAQLSQTLSEALAGRDMSITDGGKPVAIPNVGDAFNASDFTRATGPPALASQVYYLNGGRVRDEAGKTLPGPVDQADTFSSVALGQKSSTSPLLVAGVVGSGSSGRLSVGTMRAGVQPTALQGALTRPAFVPGRDEVWIGDGSRVFRVTLGGGRARVYPVPIPAVSGGGQVIAVRLSPEGSRIAIVVSGAAGSAQLYIGSIVRGAGPVGIGGVEQISPNGVVVRDVAWLDSVRVFAVGYFAGSQDAHTFETGVDGTEWTNAGLGNLPNPPDAVAGATGANVWVSAGSNVWKQSGSGWVSPGPTGQTPGSAPVYLE